MCDASHVYHPPLGRIQLIARTRQGGGRESAKRRNLYEVYTRRYTRDSAKEVLDDDYDGIRERRRPLESHAGSVAGSLILETVPSRIEMVDLESIIPGVVIGAEQAREGLTDEENAMLRTLLDHEMAANTRRNYLSQWKRFQEWVEERKVESLPAAPEHIVAYLLERVICGYSSATLRASVKAISYMHRVSDCDDPCTAPEVSRTLSAATRMLGRAEKQAKPLTEDVYEMIRRVACVPRVGKGGNLERPETALRRGSVDIAMIGLMRDGLLRVSEASDVTWDDIEERPDGSGRLLIPRSKTDVEGRGFVAFLSDRTMSYLDTIREGASGAGRVIGLRPNQISKRIKRAAMQAGFGKGFSGHSCRVGMACDLAREGIELPRIMQVGRWTVPQTVSRYIRNEFAGRNAVADYYSYHLLLS